MQATSSLLFLKIYSPKISFVGIEFLFTHVNKKTGYPRFSPGFPKPASQSGYGLLNPFTMSIQMFSDQLHFTCSEMPVFQQVNQHLMQLG
jgi:hypothetical protein